MKMKSIKQGAWLILTLSVHFIRVSYTDKVYVKRGSFIPVEEQRSLSGRKLITTLISPSELACSQKCLQHEGCQYKRYDTKTKHCDILQELSEEDFHTDTNMINRAMPITKSTFQCKQKSDNWCGEACVNTSSRSQGNRSYCDCREKGVYDSCDAALSANCFWQAVYWIFPLGISRLTSVECMKNANNQSLTIFHHDSESAEPVDGYEDKGSYRRDFRYDIDLHSIIKIINQSSACKQHTRIECFAATISDYLWISGRDGKKLEYLGGGPSNGKGCACSIAKTCAESPRSCNCDTNDYHWRTDEGFVTMKDHLPVTAINAGDTGGETEKLIYTVGPLMCVF